MAIVSPMARDLEVSGWLPPFSILPANPGFELTARNSAAVAE
jgi:hypothetical protein